MALQWDESLVLGLEEIDDQHRSIFEHFQKMSEAVQKGEPTKIIEQLSVFLSEYAAIHFKAEEKIMAEYGYPEIAAQQHEHAEFTKDANLLKETIKKDGITQELAIETTGKLFRWIIKHIKTDDKQMVAYIKEHMAAK
ncbi:MAG: hemerythrin family protein [Desulfobulbaceae bacterium]|nr:hemerythrin family protein [Desulfobulbaceae bacterium]